MRFGFLVIVVVLALIGCQHRGNRDGLSDQICFDSKTLVCPQGLGFYRVNGDSLFIHNNENQKTYVFTVSDSKLVDSIDLGFCKGFVVKMASYGNKTYAFTSNAVYDVNERRRLKYISDSSSIFFSDQTLVNSRYVGLTTNFYNTRYNVNKAFAYYDLRLHKLIYIPMNPLVGQRALARVSTSVPKTVEFGSGFLGLTYSFLDTLYIVERDQVVAKVKLEGENKMPSGFDESLNQMVRFSNASFSNSFMIKDFLTGDLFIVRKFPKNDGDERRVGKLYRYSIADGLQEVARCLPGFPVIVNRSLYVVEGTRTGKICLHHVAKI